MHAQQEVNTSACIHADRIELSVHSYNRAILRSHWASYMCTTNLPLQQSERSAALHSLAAPTSATAAKSGGAGGRAAGPAEHSQLTDRVLSDVQTAAVALLLRQRAPESPEQTLGELEQLSSICGKCSC